MADLSSINRKILIIDDDEDDCALVAETLKEIDSKLKCVSLTESKDVVTYLTETETPPGIIFLDLHMPKMTGLELLKILKADSEMSKIPVIVCTDSKLIREIDESKMLGAAYVIMKPSSFILMKFEVRKALNAITTPVVVENKIRA